MYFLAFAHNICYYTHGVRHHGGRLACSRGPESSDYIETRSWESNEKEESLMSDYQVMHIVLQFLQLLLTVVGIYENKSKK